MPNEDVTMNDATAAEGAIKRLLAADAKAVAVVVVITAGRRDALEAKAKEAGRPLAEWLQDAIYAIPTGIERFDNRATEAAPVAAAYKRPEPPAKPAPKAAPKPPAFGPGAPPMPPSSFEAAVPSPPPAVTSPPPAVPKSAGRVLDLTDLPPLAPEAPVRRLSVVPTATSPAAPESKAAAPTAGGGMFDF